MGHSALLAAASTIPLDVLGQTSLAVRPEWKEFRLTGQYDSLLKAIRLMKANSNSASPNSWNYWTNIHMTACPHGVAYFLAWHRGYLYYFERQLRLVSGDPKLVLPYWDYYSYATLPDEFRDARSTNPLYVPRINTNVRPALTLAPFSSSLVNFQTGRTSAFEPNIEGAPHNQLHNIIGNAMANMNSPVDPIFWLHHANVDRLWVAWVSAGGGRTMPAPSQSYWSGKHTYTSSLTMPRANTYSTRTTLGYRYKNESFPVRLPLAQSPSQSGDPNIRRVQATSNDLQGVIPAIGSFRLSVPRQTSEQRRAIAGVLDVGLDQRSVSAQLPLGAEQSRVLADISKGKPAAIQGDAKLYRSTYLVLDGIEVTETGKNGGYFYKLYLNIPATSKLTRNPTSIYIGSLGPFEISAAAHHAHGSVRLQYPLVSALAAAGSAELGMMSVSFVRVDGDQSPKGGVIGLGEVRLEVSTEEGSF